MDRVKAAIFSSLGEVVIGARVLDLFAGSGALGIEGLSRGAASAAFVDDDPEAVKCIRANLEKAHLQGNVSAMDVWKFLKRSDERFDLIFADPPYAKGDRDVAAELIFSDSLARVAAADAILVLEKMPVAEAPESPFWQCTRRKKYGSTEIDFFQLQRQQ